MFKLNLVLAASHLTPALAFGAVPACVDMDAPSFSAVMEQLAAQVPFFRPEDYPTCASAAGVCRLAAAIASACPVTCNNPCATGSKEPIDLCEPPASVPAEDFSLDTYISAPWFVQESVPKPYNRRDEYNRGKRGLLTYWRPAYCTTAQYERFEAPTDQGYTLRVMNYDQDSEGNEYGTWLNKTDPGTGALCAIQDETTKSQLSVQFCPFAIPATPNYLVLFYDEDEGVALVTEATFVRDGAGAPCVPIGMWIFTRQQARNETLVDMVRSIAVAKGIDVSVLKYNNQTTCLS